MPARSRLATTVRNLPALGWKTLRKKRDRLKGEVNALDMAALFGDKPVPPAYHAQMQDRLALTRGVLKLKKISDRKRRERASKQ